MGWTMTTATTRKIEIELSNDAFAHRRWEPETVAKEMRLLWLVEEVRQRRLGFAKAAEIANVPQARFLEFMSNHQVSPFDFDEEEFEEELS